MVTIQVLIEGIKNYLPNIINIVLIILVAFFANFITNKLYNFIRKQFGYKSIFSKYTIKIGIYAIAIILFLLNIPGIQGGMVQIFLVVMTGMVAFSSSTLIANGMSGVLIKSLKQYKIGDVVGFEGELGKVTELSFFHTEIETSKRTLVTIPNSLIMSKKMINLSQEGSIISAKVSLGYDVARTKVEKILIIAAKNIGLKQIFVSVLELGDYSIVYEVNGLLKDVNKIVPLTSLLRKEILDECSKANIEIVSPSFVNWRDIKKKQFIAKYRAEEKVSEILKSADDVQKLMFEKGNRSERLLLTKEKLELELKDLIRKKENLEKALDKVKKEPIKKKLGRKFKRMGIRIKSLERKLAKLAEQRKIINKTKKTKKKIEQSKIINKEKIQKNKKKKK